MDWVAMLLTQTGTWLLSGHRRIKTGWAFLCAGGFVYMLVAGMSSFGGRPVYGLFVGSAMLMINSVKGMVTAPAPRCGCNR